MASPPRGGASPALPLFGRRGSGPPGAAGGKDYGREAWDRSGSGGVGRGGGWGEDRDRGRASPSPYCRVPSPSVSAEMPTSLSHRHSSHAGQAAGGPEGAGPFSHHGKPCDRHHREEDMDVSVGGGGEGRSEDAESGGAHTGGSEGPPPPAPQSALYHHQSPAFGVYYRGGAVGSLETGNGSDAAWSTRPASPSPLPVGNHPALKGLGIGGGGGVGMDDSGAAGGWGGSRRGGGGSAVGRELDGDGDRVHQQSSGDRRSAGGMGVRDGFGERQGSASDGGHAAPLEPMIHSRPVPRRSSGLAAIIASRSEDSLEKPVSPFSCSLRVVTVVRIIRADVS